MTRAAADWRISAVRLRGIDVVDDGFNVRPGEDLDGITIEMTNRVTHIIGIATNARREQVDSYSVIVFAQDRDKWVPGSRFFRTTRSEGDGKFRISGLPPGRYNVVALAHVDRSDAGDPGFLQLIAPKASRFSLADGETKTLALTVLQ